MKKTFSLGLGPFCCITEVDSIPHSPAVDGRNPFRTTLKLRCLRGNHTMSKFLKAGAKWILSIHGEPRLCAEFLVARLLIQSTEVSKP